MLLQARGLKAGEGGETRARPSAGVLQTVSESTPVSGSSCRRVEMKLAVLLRTKSLVLGEGQVEGEGGVAQGERRKHPPQSDRSVIQFPRRSRRPTQSSGLMIDINKNEETIGAEQERSGLLEACGVVGCSGLHLIIPHPGRPHPPARRDPCPRSRKGARMTGRRCLATGPCGGYSSRVRALRLAGERRRPG